MKALLNSMVAAVMLVASFTASSAIFSFDQSEYDVVVGETFEVTLFVDTEGDSLFSFDLGLDFDALFVELRAIDFNSDWLATGNTQNALSFSASLDLVSFPIGTVGLDGGAIELATFTFGVLSSGLTTLNSFANEDFFGPTVSSVFEPITDLTFNASNINISEVSTPSIAILAMLGGFVCLMRRKLI